MWDLTLLNVLCYGQVQFAGIDRRSRSLKNVSSAITCVLNFRLITIALQIDLSFFQRSPATDENHHTQVAKKCYKMIQFR
jgi:hypothetical protein